MVRISSSPEPTVQATLILEDGSIFNGYSFGANRSIAGEVVFNTGMVGYPETLTDPSYKSQILTLAYPLIGNYGVPKSELQNNLSHAFESTQIQISGLIVSDYSQKFSHYQAKESLGDWLIENEIPALYGIDTRSLTRKLREKGTMLGKIQFDGEELEFYDPDKENLVEKVSHEKPTEHGSGKKRVVLIDCGSKHNIIHNLIRRGLKVMRVPWDYDFRNEQFDGLVISNGPGNPKMCRKTIYNVRHTISKKIPTLGICLGNQLLALAVGANTYKLKYGHRSQNQPVMEVGTDHCWVTSQNHGYAVDTKTLPNEWEPWFVNLNDDTNEGIRHRSGLFKSVQFHPEANPGPVDAELLFDDFVRLIN